MNSTTSKGHKTPLNVCMLAYTFYEFDNRVMRYAETLAARGDHVDVLALRMPEGERHAVINGVTVYRIQDRLINEKGPIYYLWRIVKFLFKSLWLAAKLHLRKPYDIIHVHSVPDFEVFAALVPKLFGAKVILDIHDIVPEFYASKFHSSKNGFIYNALLLIEKLSIAFSDHVIISNHIWKKTLESRSVRSGKCTAIINYPDPSIFFPRKGQQAIDKFVMMYPGTINWHQGLDIAVNAFNLIKDKAPNAYLHIYGDGTHKNHLIDLVCKLNLKNRVRVYGSVPIKKIAEVVASADLGIIPKRNDQFGGEAFSTKTLEFMASNVPIIVSKTKIDGYYFDESVVTFFEPENIQSLANAMLQQIENKERRFTQARNAKSFADENSWRVKKHLYLNLITELL